MVLFVAFFRMPPVMARLTERDQVLQFRIKPVRRVMNVMGLNHNPGLLAITASPVIAGVALSAQIVPKISLYELGVVPLVPDRDLDTVPDPCSDAHLDFSPFSILIFVIT